MNVVRIADLPAEAADGAPGVSVRHLRKSDQASLKVLVLPPGAATHLHEHAHSHDVVVLTGSALIRSDRGDRQARAGQLVAIGPGEEHALVNPGREELQLLCLDCFAAAH